MRYSADPAILRNEDLGEIAWAAIEPIWDDLPMTPIRVLSNFMESLTAGQQGLIALDWCQKEIRNGGIGQLFKSSTGNLVPWGLDGFRMIGGTKYAAILEEAAGLLGCEYPVTASGRKKAYKSLSLQQLSRVKDLENAFLELLDSETDNLELLRGSYVKRNPSEFVDVGRDG